jgi:flagellar biosynthesis/type III secretory pathway M-ring protein FliF/YscJ
VSAEDADTTSAAYPGQVGAIGGWDEGLWALVPTIAVCLIFWFVMRAILRSDRTEREAQARIEAEEDARLLAEADARREPPRS